MKEFYVQFDDLCKAFGALADAIVEGWNTLISPIRELCKILKTVEVPEKKSYIRVKKIIPNKVVLINKRLNVHYCRNNC